MASLQTLRDKGGIIVAVIIGLALVAFVLGDMITSGSRLFGGANSTVGVIDGTKITYTEYSNQLQYMSEIQRISVGDQANNEEMSEAAKGQAWEQLVRQYALKPALDKVGLVVSTDELADLMGGKNVSPMVAQMFTNPQTGQFDHAYLAQFVENLSQDASGRLQMFWSYLTNEVSDQTQMMKLRTLIDKGAYVTTFEAKNLAQWEGDNRSVRFVAKQYSQFQDSTVKVAESEMRKFYDAHKNLFRASTTSTIEYVAFNALPSTEDYAAAERYINQLVTDFTSTENVTQFASLNSQSPLDTRYYKAGEISGDLGKFAFESTTDQIYGPVLTADQYTVSRISDIKVLPDSINVGHIAIAAGEKAKADSIAAEIRKKPESFKTLATQFSMDEQAAVNGGELGAMDPQVLPEVFSTPLLKAKKGDVLVVETPQSIHIFKVNSLSGESRKVQLATIKYAVEASEQTRTGIYNDANNFATAAIKGFAAATTEKSLVPRTATIQTSDRNVQGLQQSRELVRWGLTGKDGDVSKVMDFGDTFVVATITKVTEEGTQPYDAVKEDIKNQLFDIKKGEVLAAQMAGASTVDALAEKMGAKVIDATDVNFSTFVVPEVGLDPAFAGGICGMDASKLSKPIVGRAAVYVAQVVGQDNQNISVETEKTRLSAENAQRAFVSAYQAIYEMSTIKDYRYKFF